MKDKSIIAHEYFLRCSSVFQITFSDNERVTDQSQNDDGRDWSDPLFQGRIHLEKNPPIHDDML